MIDAYVEGKGGQLELCFLLKDCNDCLLETLKHTIVPLPSTVLLSEIAVTVIPKQMILLLMMSEGR